MSLSFNSYFSSSVVYFVLFVFLIFKFKKNSHFIFFLLAVGLSLLWSIVSYYIHVNDNLYLFEAFPFESLKNVGWYLFLFTQISRQQFDNHIGYLKEYVLPKVIILFVGLLIVIEFSVDLRIAVQDVIKSDFRLLAHVLLATIGLLLIEQLYRNATLEQRWNIKFLCIGLGGIFTFDFIIYSKSLLFSSLDDELWNIRGYINSILVPLLLLSVFRLDSKTYSVRVSRQVIFHSTALFGVGIYLLIMSVAGYWIRDYGGSWGSAAQFGFMFLAVVLLLLFFLSGQARALAKVYLSKHFIQHRYDYREEWLKLSKTLAELESINAITGYIVTTIAKLVDSSGGGIWIKNEQGDFHLIDEYNLGFEGMESIPANNLTIAFIIKKQWVIDFVENDNTPEIYAGAELQQWDSSNNNIWLIVPLFFRNELEAFVILTKPRVPRQIDWQDHDLLKTAGMQLANALVLCKASEDLSRSRQFEAYNRLSAFLVHDLKNLVAQINMIVKNSEKHKHNPEFIDDSIETLENVASKMSRILSQLKQGKVESTQTHNIDLVSLINDLKIQQHSQKPELQTVIAGEEHYIKGDQEKIISAISHLVQNAQDATPDDGWVKLTLKSIDSKVILTVEDNGCGMSEAFIKQRLFKPFDTTKGNAGMGIGVYEAKEYIMHHKGSIDVESKEGEGTVFTLKFPLLEL